MITAFEDLVKLRHVVILIHAFETIKAIHASINISFNSRGKVLELNKSQVFS